MTEIKSQAATVYITQSAPLAPGEGLGHQIKPFAAMGALFVAAGAARIAIHATGADEEIAWATSMAAFVLAVVTAVASKRRFLPKSKVLRHRFVAALYLGAGWVAAVAHQGLTLGAVAALAIVGTCLSLAFLREHSISAPPPALLPVFDAHDPYVERWAKNMGANGKPLTGSKLLPNPVMIRAGYQYTLELVPGPQTVRGAKAMEEQIRGALRLQRGHDIIVEAHPDEREPTVRLTIVVKSPIKESRPWPGAEAGFDSATGSVNLGPFVDDEGIAQWDVYRENGIFGGFMQGDPGSGKSRMFESIAMSVGASTSHPTVVWFACGQNGASSPMLLEHADWAATTVEDFHEMLFAATRIYKMQSKENIAYRYQGFTPTAERPGLLIFADELHGLVEENPALGGHPILGPANAKMMLAIAREARKAGVAIVAADQSPTMDAFGGSGNGMMTLRSSMTNGNGVLLRSDNPNAKQVFKVDIDPSRFPKDKPGYAYLAKPRTDARSAPYRGYRVMDDQMETEPKKIGWRTLTRRQTAVAGDLYARRHQIAKEREEALLAELEMIDAGLFGTLEEIDRQMEKAAAVKAEEAKVGMQPLEFAEGIPSVRPVQRFWMTAEPDAQSTPMTPGETKVLAALAKGPAKPGELAKRAGLSESGVHAILGKLVERGLADQPQKYGPYQIKQRQAA
jgi:hypothetical protein